MAPNGLGRPGCRGQRQRKPQIRPEPLSISSGPPSPAENPRPSRASPLPYPQPPATPLCHRLALRPLLTLGTCRELGCHPQHQAQHHPRCWQNIPGLLHLWSVRASCLQLEKALGTRDRPSTTSSLACGSSNPHGRTLQCNILRVATARLRPPPLSLRHQWGGWDQFRLPWPWGDSSCCLPSELSCRAQWLQTSGETIFNCVKGVLLGFCFLFAVCLWEEKVLRGTGCSQCTACEHPDTSLETAPSRIRPTRERCPAQPGGQGGTGPELPSPSPPSTFLWDLIKA